MWIFKVSFIGRYVVLPPGECSVISYHSLLNFHYLKQFPRKRRHLPVKSKGKGMIMITLSLLFTLWKQITRVWR